MSLSKPEIKEIQDFVEAFDIKNDSQLKEGLHALGIGKAVMIGCEAVAKKYKLNKKSVLNTFRDEFESFLERYDRGLQEVFFKDK